MRSERRNTTVNESVKNAATGYGAIVLGITCFVLVLAVLSAIVRIIVGASAGA